MVRVYAVEAGSNCARYLELDQADWAYWLGEGAERLQLDNPVNPYDFGQLTRGIDPVSKDVLRARQARALTHNEKPYALGRSVFDTVVFAPKSVAVVGLVDERVVEAHKAAVRTFTRPLRTRRRSGYVAEKRTKQTVHVRPGT
jgi:conjugative relaxase-like TrwC/TraI family protein